MKRFFKLGFTVLFIAGLVTNAFGAIRYVSQSGNNSWTGTTTNLSGPNGPKLTIAAGLTATAANDTLSIMAGTYNEKITSLQIPSGTGSSYTILSNYQSQLVIIKPVAPASQVMVIGSTAARTNIWITGITFDGTGCPQGQDVIKLDQLSAFSKISNCIVKNGPRGGILWGYSLADQQYAHNWEIVNSTITTNGWTWTTGSDPHGLYIAGPVYSNRIHGNTVAFQRGGSAPHLIHVYSGGPQANSANLIYDNFLNGGFASTNNIAINGVGMYQMTNNHVYNNIVINCYRGIYSAFNGDWTPNFVENNTVWNCYAGILSDQVGGGLVWRNNLVTRSGFQGIGSASGAGSITLSNNLASQNAVNYADSGTPDVISGNLFGNQYDPKLANTNSFDFNLTTGSSAIGTGLTLSSLFTTDYAGTTRTAPWSIGAYAFSAGVTPIFSISDFTPYVYELNAAPGYVRVTRTDTSTAITNFFDVGGTATMGVNWVTVPLSNVMSAGVSTYDIVITPINLQSLVNRTVTISLLPDPSYQLQSPTGATVTVVANIPPGASLNNRVKTR